MKEMKRRQWDVIAVSPLGVYAEKLKEEGLRFVPLRMDRKGKNPLKDAWLIWKLFEIYRSEQPALIHHFTIKPVIYGTLASRLAGGIPVVNAITGLGYAFINRGVLNKVVKYLYRISLKKSQAVIFQNAEDRSYFINKSLIGEDKAHLIMGSGVDTDKFSPLENGEKKLTSNEAKTVFLMASRMLWDKGVKEFVEASLKVKKQFPDALFWLAGGIDKGNPSMVSEEWLQKVTVGKNVKWWGHVDIKPLLEKADVIVLPSYREGLPKGLLEGASMEKPLITTDTPGCRDAVSDGETGLLVPVKDVEKLAEAMVWMVEHPGERAAMGKKGRERVLKYFSDEVAITRTIDVYRNLGIMEDYQATNHLGSGLL